METKIKKTALKIMTRSVRRIEDNFRSWEEDCRQDREDGYRPHYCPHGTDCWTDYDNICGPCEDGLTTPRDYIETLAYEAKANAKLFWADMETLKQAYLLLDSLEINFPFGDYMDKLGKRYGLFD